MPLENNSAHRPKVILVTGLAGVGKSTLCEYVCKLSWEIEHYFLDTADMADAMYAMFLKHTTMEVEDFKYLKTSLRGEAKKLFRKMLQDYGTYVTATDKVAICKAYQEEYLNGCAGIMIFSGIRRKEELAFYKEKNDVIFHIHVSGRFDTSVDYTHDSEAQVVHLLADADYLLENKGDKEQYEKDIALMYHQYLFPAIQKYHNSRE